MIQQLLEVNEATPIPEMQERLGRVLGLGRPVPMPVLLRAIEDPGFAGDLLTCRDSPEFLTALFDDRRTRAYADTAESVVASPVQLAGKAAAALARWGKSGFSTVDAETLERRESACLACPHLVDPQSALQKLVPVGAKSEAVGSRLGSKTCELCGCVSSKKIRLPTESCPSIHPVLAGLTRWREPTPAQRLEARTT